MVRHYTTQPLEREVIDRVVRSALRAPSAGYAQGWAFLVLTCEADRERFWRFAPVRAERASAVQNAPLIVVPMSNKDAYLDRYTESDKGWTDRDEARWPAPYWHIDTGMVDRVGASPAQLVAVGRTHWAVQQLASWGLNEWEGAVGEAITSAAPRKTKSGVVKVDIDPLRR